MKYELVTERVLFDRLYLIFPLVEFCQGKSLLYEGKPWRSVINGDSEKYAVHAINAFISQRKKINDSLEIEGWQFKNDDNQNTEINFIKRAYKSFPKSEGFINSIVYYYENLIDAIIDTSCVIDSQDLSDEITVDQAFVMILGAINPVYTGVTIRNIAVKNLDFLDKFNKEDIATKELHKIGDFTELLVLMLLTEIPLYSYFKNDWGLDILNLESFESKIGTQDFLEWAVNKGFIKEMTTNEEPTERDKRVAIVKEILILYLKERNRPTNILSLSKDTEFHALFANTGLTIIQDVEDTSKKNPNSFVPTTLGDYFNNIVTSPEWKDQPEDIKNKLPYTPKPKK